MYSLLEAFACRKTGTIYYTVIATNPDGQFNNRVLEEALDGSNPLLDRVKFLQ